MPSAFIRSGLSYPAMLLAKQLVHHRSVHPGPLVLGAALLKFPTPTTDRDRTVSRRSEPSSRTALMGGQPNPWNYPQGSFYPLSHGHSILNRRITISDFRPCSTCRSRSQAPFCNYARRLISNQSEGTFERLRYSLGGDRPSQTTHLTLSPWLM